jgi:curved DNA-binding protein CbpA
MEELRKLYRALAKRFHPDLTTNPEEKLRRQEKMAVINQAYMEQDQAQLVTIADEPEKPVISQERTREHKVLDLYEEIDRLDELIQELERQINELNTSDELHLALEFSLAQHAGRDLLGEHAAFYKEQIHNLEQELDRLIEK